MHVLTVAYLHCTLQELSNRTVFEEAAKFTRWECTVYIRCDDTGQDLQVNCTPPASKPVGVITPAHCWGWRYFYDHWVRKHGPI